MDPTDPGGPRSIRAGPRSLGKARSVHHSKGLIGQETDVCEVERRPPNSQRDQAMAAPDQTNKTLPTLPRRSQARNRDRAVGRCPLICQTLATTLNAAFAASQPGAASTVAERQPLLCNRERSEGINAFRSADGPSKGGRSDIVGRSYGRKICDSLALVLTAAVEDARSGIVFACEGVGK